MGIPRRRVEIDCGIASSASTVADFAKRIEKEVTVAQFWARPPRFLPQLAELPIRPPIHDVVQAFRPALRRT